MTHAQAKQKSVNCRRKENSELLVSGFLHEISPLNYIHFPTDVQILVVEYYETLVVWSADVCAEHFEFNEENPNYVKYTKYSTWGMIIIEDEISINSCMLKKSAKVLKCHEFEWEFKLDGKFGLKFGFISADVSKDCLTGAQHESLGCASSAEARCGHDFCCIRAFSEEDNFSLYGRDGLTISLHVNDSRFDINKKYPFKDGDCFGLKFNFDEMICSLFYNGEFVSIVYHEIPSNIILIIGCYYPSGITCTKLGPI